MSPNPADPIVVVAKLLALWIGIELAAFIAPHIVILLAGVTGAVFGLMSWRSCTRIEAFGYVFAMTVVAWLFAGSCANLLMSYAGQTNPGPLLAPAAAGIAWTGHRWPAVGRWMLSLVRKAIEARAGS